MPKIRGVKPEFWTDEDVCELSIPARLLFIGLWNLACDNGHVQDKSRQIKMRLLPSDDVNVAELLREIEAQGLIGRDAGWITIPNLPHHQKPHKRWWSVCDKPGCVPPEGSSHAPSNRGTTVAPQGNNGVATVGHGCATADGDCEGDGEGEGEVKDLSATADRFDDFWNTYPSRAPHSNPKKTARDKFKAACKKADPDTIIAAAAAYARLRAGQDPQHTAMAATWLNQERWNDDTTAATPSGKIRTADGRLHHPDDKPPAWSPDPPPEDWDQGLRAWNLQQVIEYHKSIGWDRDRKCWIPA